ncbi:MAG: GNAT family N-acetyltransferase [Lachnospiraceae bacterium]
MCDYIIRPILASDDLEIAKIIRDNLEQFHLDIPGTAYYDKELDTLSKFYNALPEKRRYFIITDKDNTVIGGVGIGEFEGFDCCAELQKLYLTDAAKGKGLGKKLMETAEKFAKNAGYRQLYLETHTNLEAAIGLYEKLGFHQIEKPDSVLHSTMNRFYLKML